jgi:hypothetical protein
MSNIDKQALRGQSVEGSFYLAECGHCGEMYPSNKLNGGEPLFSSDYGECFCHLCGADDTDIADCGAWGSEGVTAWNYQQKRIEALLDELEAAEKRNAELVHNHRVHAARLIDERSQLKQRIAELEAWEKSLRTVGVMSKKAFQRLEGRESRFIALWPRPEIYLPRKRPADGVIVYARVAGAAKGE